MIGIYCIENLINNKKYIGKSSNIEQRLSHHKWQLSQPVRHKDCNRLLFYSVEKYGIDNFHFYALEIFDKIDEDILADCELEWMDKYNTCDRNFGYNLRRDSSTQTTFHKDTLKLKSENSKGEKNPNFGNRWNNEQKLHMSEVAKSRHLSGEYYTQEWKDKIGKKATEMWKNEEKKSNMATQVRLTKQKKFRWLQYSRNGELIKTWETVEDILKENPTYKWQNIYAAANYYKPTYMNFVWKKVPK